MKKKMSRRAFIKKTAQAGIVMGLAGPRIWGESPVYNYDVVIKNGTVIDGFKDYGYKADVGISGELIKTVGNLKQARGKVIIDASGRIVSPGFIDIHTHTDFAPFRNTKAESKVRQGVTTELTGNCGSSAFPVKPTNQDEEKENTLKIDWTDLAGYHSRLEKNKFAINHATLIGHGTLRSNVMGDKMRQPSAQELDKMKGIVAEAMDQGAFGLSSGLEYAPGLFASPEELIELCRVAAKYGGFYATHIRSEDNQVIESIAEAIYIAERAEIPLQISHIKAGGTNNWWKLPMMFDLIERANKRGLQVHADRYPYNAYSTGLSVYFPAWALDGGDEQFLTRLKDKDLRQRMRAETLEKLKGYPWENLVITDVSIEENLILIGKNLRDASAERNQDPYEFMCDLLIEEGGDVSHIGFGMSEENTELILKHPLVMLGSDGSSLAPYGPLSQGIPHPRNYGAFPRFLGFYVREKKIVSLPVAIKKITSIAALKMRLQDRGTIREGNFADLVVFDFSTIADKATYTNSEQYPEGIDYVIVNGKTVIDHGNHSGELPGKILKSSGKWKSGQNG